MPIERKRKKCKGNYRSSHFKGCGELKYIEKYGLCLQCYREWCYSTGEGQEHIKKYIIPKAKKDVKQKEKEDRNKLKNKLKKLSEFEAEAKTVFQKWVRKVRDKNKPCISCGTKETDLWDGGHFYKAEIYSGLIFDERNVNKQCRKCNRFLGGNENQYRLGLIERFGRVFVLQLDADAIKLRNHKYSREELTYIKEKYKRKLKNNEL